MAILIEGPQWATRLSSIAVLLIALLTSAALAQDALADESVTSAGAEKNTRDSPLDEQQYPNDSYISLQGTVVSAGLDSFLLDFAGKQIEVEMDDSDRENEQYPLLSGDVVTVWGRVDADLFERQKIEARSVFLPKVNKTFYASSVDDEDLSILNELGIPSAPEITVVGYVEDPRSAEFTLRSVATKIRVDTNGMQANPLDEDGVPTLEEGDYVRVTGTVDQDFFEAPELAAKEMERLAEEDA